MDLKGKGEATMEAEEIQLKRTLQGDGQSAVTSNNKYNIIQIIVACAFMVYSFTLMFAVVRGDGVGRAVREHTICFSIFFVADTLACVASSAVTMILVTRWHVSAKMNYFMCITVLAAGVFLVLSYHATAYAVVPSNSKWIVLCLGGVSTIALALLFHQLSTTLRSFFNEYQE